MDGLDGNTITIIVTMLAVSLGLYYFLSKQVAAAEKRLRDEISDVRGEIAAVETQLRDEIRESETRLRNEIRAVDTRLRDEITAVETRLRDEIRESETRLRGEIKESETRLRNEIRAVDTRLERSVEANTRRFDETSAETRILINDVGVVKGALGVSTQSRERELVSAE